METLAQVLWFFLPGFIANQCPGIAAKLNLPLHVPVSARWLGRNKTWDAYYVGGCGGVATIYLQRLFPAIDRGLTFIDYTRDDLVVVGLLMGVGAIAGDHIKSFFKRLVGIVPGERWWPFDQLDFVVGGLVVVTPYVGWIGWGRGILLASVALFVHPVGNWFGYKIGLRKVPW